MALALPASAQQRQIAPSTAAPEQALEAQDHRSLAEVRLQIDKMHELCINVLYFRHDILNPGMQFARAEWRKRGCAAKFKHDINLYRAKRGSLGAI